MLKMLESQQHAPTWHVWPNQIVEQDLDLGLPLLRQYRNHPIEAACRISSF